MALIAMTILVTPVCWSQTDIPKKLPATSSDDAKLAQRLIEGKQFVRAGKFKEAIVYFDQVASAYEEEYKNSKDTILCARSSVESLAYLLEAANKNKKNTVVLGSSWSDAYFLKAYTLVSLRQIEEAKIVLARAIALSPGNSQYRAELGYIYQSMKNWTLSLETYRIAERNAQDYSAPEAKNSDLSRAWRGKADALVELGQLDEAEQRYRQCLALDSNDQIAKDELSYVQSQKLKKASQ